MRAGSQQTVTPPPGRLDRLGRMLRPAPFLLLLGLCSLPAAALTLPLNGWTASDASGATWTDEAGACVLREQQLTQAYPVMPDAAAARTFAVRLQNALAAQKLTEVAATPVDRAGRWTVLASYIFEDQGVKYSAVQLYLSSGGKLRTLTGSAAQGEASECVNQMRQYLRYLAD
jgi:hypothetical protein